jgi:isopenicillin N synthase-like dioxygenase
MLETTTTTPELNVPIIDLAKVYDDSTSEDEIVKMIGNACSEFGFFHVVNHGISVQTIQQYSDQCRRYFALPREVKQQWKRGDGNSRGYFDDELTKQKRDWKEALDFGVPGQRTWSVPDDCDDPPNKCLDGFNQFPTEEELPGFRTVVTTYFDACAELSDRIAILMAKGLGVGPDAANSPMIRELREKHSSYLRSNHYPPCDDTENNLGISPHRDAGFLTVLLQDQETHSLQVWKDGHWITVHPEPGAFTINTGDMAQIYSNGRYKVRTIKVFLCCFHSIFVPSLLLRSFEVRLP